MATSSKIPYEVTAIKKGGTGGTTAAKAKDNLGLGSETNNFELQSDPSSITSRLGLIIATVGNTNNNSYNGKRCLVSAENHGLDCINYTDNDVIWRLTNKPSTSMSSSDIQSSRLTIASGGSIKYIVRNGICYVHCSKVKINGANFSASSNVVLYNLPKAASDSRISFPTIVNNVTYIFDFWINSGEASMYAKKVENYTNELNFTLSYPVDFSVK